MNRPKLSIVTTATASKSFGSPAFIRITRNPGLRSPVRFEPTTKREGDIVL